MKRLFTFIIYKTAGDILLASFFDCLIFLNSPFSSFSLLHISPFLTLFSLDFCLCFLGFIFSAFSRFLDVAFRHVPWFLAPRYCWIDQNFSLVFARICSSLYVPSHSLLDFSPSVASSSCLDTSWTWCESCSSDRNLASQTMCIPRETRANNGIGRYPCSEPGSPEAFEDFVFPSR